MASKIQFWQRVEERLQEMGMTKSELWRRIGIPHNTGKGWLLYGRLPDAEQCVRIASALALDIRYLMTGEKVEQSAENPPRYGAQDSYPMDILSDLQKIPGDIIVALIHADVTRLDAVRRALGIPVNREAPEPSHE